MSSNAAEYDYNLGGARSYGAIFGLGIRDPQSATLTAVTEGGVARVRSTTLGQKWAEVVVAESTKAFTASKDTYVFLKTDGTYAYIEVANGAAKPTQATVDAANGAYSLWIAKVVTDGSRVTDGGVTDYRVEAGHGELVEIGAAVSFVTAEQGAKYITLPFNGRIIAVQATVDAALGATDTGTLTLALGKNGKFTNITTGVITGAISAAVAVRYAAYPTAANGFRTGDTLRLTSLKTTTGGKLDVRIFAEKLPK